MNSSKILEFGIEIVAAMMASAHHVDIEQGRLMALDETEIDTILSEEEYSALPLDKKAEWDNYVDSQRERLHSQARYVAQKALVKYKELKKERPFNYWKKHRDIAISIRKTQIPVQMKDYEGGNLWDEDREIGTTESKEMATRILAIMGYNPPSNK